MSAPECLRLAAAQLHLPVGDLQGNAERIADAMEWAESRDVDVLVLPELALTGYPPEDLLHSSPFVDENLAVLERLAAYAGETVSVVGFVDQVPATMGADSSPRTLANAVAVLWDGKIRSTYYKRLLPNYGVFDERRYFEPGEQVGGTWAVRGAEVGLLVCEDLWRHDLADAQAADGAQALLVANASPFHRGKVAERAETITDTARRCGLPVVYAGNVGGQGEVVFDGGSAIADATGRIVARAPFCEEALLAVDVTLGHPRVSPRRSTFVCRPIPRTRARAELPPPPLPPVPRDEDQVYRALVRGLADYVVETGAATVIVGLSGGVDASLVATLAADALGPDRVIGMQLPGQATPVAAVEDATELAHALGIAFEVLGIADVHAMYRHALAVFSHAKLASDAEENLLPRIRATALLGLADQHDGLVLATGNKTETAVGYGTLYGDMAGHFAVLKDVPKTLVYELCQWRNSLDAAERGWVPGRELIPTAIIEKTPSAERTPDRPDRELPAPYEVVDALLEGYLELARTPDELVDDGFEPDVVQRVIDLVKRNERTRHQLAPGVKVTAKAFGRDLRIPLVHRYRATVTAPGETRPLPTRTPVPDAWLEG